MTLPSFMKHVRTLETNGLIRTTKAGRVRTCALDRERLALVEDWLAEQRRIWEERTDRLERFVTDPTEGTAMNPDLDLTLQRVIRAPRTTVWRAWTDPAQLEQWWVPAPHRGPRRPARGTPRRRARDAHERRRRRVRAPPRRVLPRRRRTRAARVHERGRQPVAPGEPRPGRDDRRDPPRRSPGRAPTTGSSSATATRPPARATKRSASSTAGARSPSSSPRSSRAGTR